MKLAIQCLRKGWRIIISPVTQILMLIGIFPAQALSQMKKVPILKSIVGFIIRKLGKDSRSAALRFQEDFVGKENPTNLKFEKSDTLYTTDFGRKVTLETFSFEPEDFKNIKKEEQYYRIHCGNNTANCGRFFIELATLSNRHPELKTIAFNHSGVEGSGGITLSQEDLINGLYAQVQHLLAQGVIAQNIELSGFSIGAATAAITAAKLKKEGISLNLYDDRTFSNMAEVATTGFPIVGLLFKILKLIPLVKEFIQYIIQPIFKVILVKPLLWLINWDMDSATAYLTIDPAQRALTVVKPKTKGKGRWRWKKIVKYLGKFTGFLGRGNGDKIIPLEASLLFGTENKTDTIQWKKAMRNLKAHIKQNNGIIQDRALLDALKPDNAISSVALKKLKSKENINAKSIKNLISLLEAGTKARRFKGVKERDAHDNTSENLTPRFQSKAMRAALAALGLDPELPNNGVTLYSLYHAAIKEQNKIFF